MSDLRKARGIMEQIRFSGDTPADDAKNKEILGAVRDFHLVNELNISRAVTPSLSKSLDAVINNLSIPPRTIEAFVYASPAIQANCYAGEDGCVIRFSSALVDILDADEFKFVAGHELGHFLFEHSHEEEEDSVMCFIRQRAREISADRAGLVACGGSINTAIKAMMKMVSGLTGEHLRFDVGTFLSQLKKSSADSVSIRATHPPILVRCRALYWFSLSGYFDDSPKNFSSEQLQKLNERVQTDLSRYVDRRAEAIIAEVKESIRMWEAISDIVKDGKFDKQEQRQFAEAFGHDNLQKLKNFLGGRSPAVIKSTVAKKLENVRAKLQELAPEKKETENSENKVNIPR